MKKRTVPLAVLLLVILAGYLAIGALYAARTPAWQAPDEPAHYNYVAQVARGGLPVIQAGDWDSAYLDAMKAAKFSPDAIGGRLDSVQYEDHQPPLYYLLAAVIFRLASGDLIALRLFSLVLGAGAVIAAWQAARTVFPAQGWLAVGAAGFVAFLPQNLAILASVNNDALAALIGGLLLTCLARHAVGDPHTPGWALPILLGLALITKLTLYPFMAVWLLMAYLKMRRTRQSLSDALRGVILTGLVAVLIAGPFWLRNLSVYGVPDFLAQAAHDRVVIGQVRTAEYIALKGADGWLRDFARVTFQSFWGQFGWMGVPMTDTIYLGLLALTGGMISGALFGLIGVYRRGALNTGQRHAVIVLGAAALLTFGALLYYNTNYAQFQGRYLYAALVPLAVAFAAGIDWWIARLAGLIRLRGSWPRWLAMIGFSAGMALFALYALFRILIPALA